MPARATKRAPGRRKKRRPEVEIALVQERLNSIYGPIEWRPRMVALDELIFTVLTQHTSDLNAERAYDTLRKLLPTWGARPFRSSGDSCRGWSFERSEPIY